MRFLESAVTFLLCGVISLPFPAFAANESGAKPAAAATADEDKGTDCHPVAKLFSATFCEEQLNPYSFDKKRYSSPNAKPDPRELMSEVSKLRQVLWQSALTHKFGDKAAPPTMEEIDNFRKNFDQSMDASYEADRQTADYISDLLNKYNYSPDNEQKLRQLLNITQASLKLYSERQQHTQNLPKEYKFVVDTAERAIARNMLTTWKDDKVLYENYHGRLELVANDVVPVDAYIEFIKYIKNDGKLAILDPQYAGVFDNMEKQLNEKHIPLPAGGDIAKKYYSKPDWQFSLSNSSARFGDLQAQLKNMPNLGPKTGADVKPEEMIGKQSHPASPLPSIDSAAHEH